MKTQCFLGIDPGKTGGFVVLDTHGNIIQKTTMPLDDDDQIDLLELSGIFYGFTQYINLTACLEKVHGFGAAHGRKQGASSIFNFGKVYGIILGNLSAFRIPFTLVPPQTWQKQMHLGVVGDTGKNRSRLVVKDYFPNETFFATERSYTMHMGLVDAALLAEYGRRQEFYSGGHAD